MDYRNANWIPWYVDDTPGWLELSLAARGAMAEISRKLNRRTGSIELRRGLPSLAGLLRVRWDGELEPAVTELLRLGKLTWNGDAGLLCDPEYLERQRPTSAERTRDWRERHRDDGDACDVTPVTVTQKRREEIREDLESTRAGVAPVLTDARRERVASIALAAGVEIDADTEWPVYVADRHRKAKPISDADWEYWLRNAAKFAKRDRKPEPRGPSFRGRKSLEGFKA